ncbi:MAG TPA: membrane protein insertase YidC [Burkholderiales bacterium]|nr:membrane protein insertase YidC [Burkholderiales bacterium]
MDTRRLILFFVFAFSLFLLTEAWQRERNPLPASTKTTPAETAPTAQTHSSSSVPQPTAAAPGTAPKATHTPAPTATPPTSAKELPAGHLIQVDTDYVHAQISTMGGDLRLLEFKKQRDAQDKSKDFVLFQDKPGKHVYVAQSGLIGGDFPNHRTVFTAVADSYTLKPGDSSISVPLEATAGGLKVTKTYTFHRGSYLIDINYKITNVSNAPVTPSSYFQFVRDSKSPSGQSVHQRATYTGAALYTEQGKYQKVSFSDIDKGKSDYQKTANNGWIAIVQHYFLGVWLPKGDVKREFYTRKLEDDLYAAGMIVPVSTIAPGQSTTLTMPLYAGPDAQDTLSKLAPGLEYTVDYGWLTIIAVPIFWCLSKLHAFVGNWGIAIILLTIIIKLLFFPLSATSYKSMARMRLLAPKMQKLKEQYGSDKQKLHQAMMEMYKKEKVNPLGGCMPIVIQIPVFIGLYYVLLQSVELRQAPFYGWIQDLSVSDPYFVLPVLMGITMFIQTHLNPVPPDPIQAKLMKFMPLIFCAFFVFFPAGLVLYYVVNNILSILQQWYITRQAEREKSAHDNK